jgi:16S rRNA C1402 (ribose-2'-O) methylase RsmI
MKLTLVPTPIGNLEDITLRAIRMLREADVIYAEDTRVTRKLLNHVKIDANRIESFHQHNEHSAKISCVFSKLFLANRYLLINKYLTTLI